MADSFEVSERDWISGVNELGSGEDIFFYIRWSFGNLFGSAFRLKADEQSIHVLLQEKSPSGSRTTLVQLYLPEIGKGQKGQYERRTNRENGKEYVVFSLWYLTEPCHDPGKTAEFRVTNSLDFLVGSGFEFRIQ